MRQILLLLLFAVFCLPGRAANWYVLNTAAGTADGSSCTNAKTTLALAFTAAAAGDTVYLCSGHAETQATNMTLTSPGTAGAPVIVECSNASGGSAATATATNCTINTTTNASITFSGFAYSYGTTFNAGTLTNGASIVIGSTAVAGWSFEADAFVLNNTNIGSRIDIGGGAGSNEAGQQFFFSNCTFQFGATAQGIVPGNARVVWKSGGSITGATIPTALFILNAGSNGRWDISGFDLSALGSGKNLLSVGTTTVSSIDFYIANSKLNASVALITGTIAGPGSVRVFVDNAASGATNYTFTHYKFQGSVTQSTATFRSGGASDGTTPLSWQTATLASGSGPTFRWPLPSDSIYVWNDNSGSSKTATIEFIRDSLTALQNNQIWSQCEYLGSSSTPLASFGSNVAADEFATPANQPSSSATWTNSMTNPNPQKLQITFTPQMKGLVRCQVYIAVASQTIYIDPVITIQ